MKKVLYLLALAAIPAISQAQDAKTVKEEDKQRLIAKCVEDAKDIATTDELKAAFKDYCTCQTENLLKELSVDEVEHLNENMEKADEATQQAMAQKMMPLIMPCMEELQSKMAASQGGE